MTGSGPPVILIPGLGASGQTWTTTVAHLRERYTCHVLTLAGFAGVPPIEGKLLPAVAAELVGYIRARDLIRPRIIGHSLGGELALSIAADHPALVGPLVVVDALPFLGGTLAVDTVEQARPIVAQMQSAMAAQTQAEREASMRSGRFTNSMTAAPADQQRLIAWSLASDRTTVEQTWLDLLSLDLRPDLGRVTVPTLVIGTWLGWGGAGGAPAERAPAARRFEDQYRALPRLRLAISDTARHFVMFDDLPWFLGELDRFLDDPDAAVRNRGVAGL